ncbi:Lrp/AsnC family transcriptional regulator [Pseudohaliea sp.]|uniref:Lrp/AsnC family transcriptional regulator n=1 Tax=Pseudohaliea sp. TaxID=2740289 RepID=UPI0032EBA08A
MAKRYRPHEIDPQVTALLSENPRLTNKAIAAQIGVAESTIATRIKTMSENRIMRVVAQRNFFTTGYGIAAWILVEVSGDDTSAVAEKLATFENVTGIGLVWGNFQILAVVAARDYAALSQFIHEEIDRVPGVKRITLDINLRFLRGQASFAEIPEKPDMKAIMAMGSTDEQITALLCHDGRSTNTRIARALHISESNVRQRIARLLESGAIRLSVVSHGTGSSEIGFVRMAVLPAKLKKTAALLLESSKVAHLSLTTGEFNLCCILNCTDRDELTRFCTDHIQCLPEVVDADVSILVKGVKARTDFFPPEEPL